jgi:hypothetical protein
MAGNAAVFAPVPIARQTSTAGACAPCASRARNACVISAIPPDMAAQYGFRIYWPRQYRRPSCAPMMIRSFAIAGEAEIGAPAVKVQVSLPLFRSTA